MTPLLAIGPAALSLEPLLAAVAIENKDIANREANSTLFGINYYVNPNLRFMFNYTKGENEVNGDETGQYALRTQFAF